MKHYIGTKLVQAEPAWKVTPPGGTAFIQPKDMEWPVENGSKLDSGYRVVYPDGYESWNPKDVFEKAYLPMTVNPNLPTDAPSISAEMVDEFIVFHEIRTLGEKTTVARAILANGFEIVEYSACVSAENYSETIGAEVCLKKIRDKVWMLLGFLLQTAVNGVDGNVAIEETKAPDNMPFGMAVELMKQGMRVSRRGWNGKGQYVFMTKEVNFATDADISEFAKTGVDVTNMLVLRTAQGKLQPGWLATQSDILAEDWYLAE